MTKLNLLDLTAFTLVIVGGLNWGLVALGWNLVGYLFASWPWLLSTVYGLVGLASLYMLYSAKKMMPAQM